MSERWGVYATWGSIAVCAVLGAAVTIALVLSTHRTTPVLQTAIGPPPLGTDPRATSTGLGPGQSSSSRTDHEIARLGDALRSLTAEREELVARLERLERSFGDITTSIGGAGAPLLRPEVTPLTPTSDLLTARATAVAAERRRTDGGAAGSTGDRASARASAPADALISVPDIMQADSAGHGSDPAPVRTQFGIELGQASTMRDLRALWISLTAEHGPLLDGLRPVVRIQVDAKSGAIELQLVAGPLANAAAAARACTSLQAKGADCRTAVFDGQRLALR